MTLVAWILSLAGAGLAFALCAGTALGAGRRLELPAAMAVVPLPALAVWFTAPELLRAVQAGTPARGLVFVGGPFVLGTLTLLAVLRAYRRQPASRV